MVSVDEFEPKVPCVISVDDARKLTAQRRLNNHVVIADVRWYPDGRNARAAFITGHIPGSVFIDVDRDLADHHNTNPLNGRHPFPPPADFARAMSKLGIGDNTHVLAYDDTGGMTAARFVVMLRMIGRSASLINGGLQAWVASSDDSLESGEPGLPTPVPFTTRPWPESRLINYDELSALVTENRTGSNSVLLDARAANRFEGRAPEAVPHLDPRSGHIPGAMNAPWVAVLDPETSHFRSTTEISEHFAQLGVSPSADVIAYCGSGVSACLNIIALEYAGLPVARLFVPSWSGWASDVDNPSETGPAMKKENRD